MFIKYSIQTIERDPYSRRCEHKKVTNENPTAFRLGKHRKLRDTKPDPMLRHRTYAKNICYLNQSGRG